MEVIKEIRELINKVRNFPVLNEQSDYLETLTNNALDSFGNVKDFKNLSVFNKALLMTLSNDEEIRNLSLVDLINDINKEKFKNEEITIKVEVIHTEKGFDSFKNKIGWIINPKIRILVGDTTNTKFVRVHFKEFDNKRCFGEQIIFFKFVVIFKQSESFAVISHASIFL